MQQLEVMPFLSYSLLAFHTQVAAVPNGRTYQPTPMFGSAFFKP